MALRNRRKHGIGFADAVSVLEDPLLEGERMRSEYDFSKGKRGAAVPTPGKERITIRIDADVLAWFRDQVHRSGGGNYQTLINEALRAFILGKSGTLERTLRRILREELKSGRVEHTRASRVG